MGYAHDDDDPFYDHEEAMQATAAVVAPTVAMPRASQYAAARASAAMRASQFGRPTLNRTASGGRSTTATFDEFLSDSDGSDDDDDGSAIQRMQEQADDMEYITGAGFTLDSPNGSMDGGDNSFRMDISSSQEGARDTFMVQKTSGAPVQDDSDSGDDADGDENEDVDNSITRPFAGLNDSFVDTRKRVVSSPDGLNSSFSLVSPNAAASSGVHSPRHLGSEKLSMSDDDSFVGATREHEASSPDGLDSSFNMISSSAIGAAIGSPQHFRNDKLSLSDDGKPSGEFNDASFVLNSPNAGGSGEYLDDNDSFTSDRPSNLDRDYSETLDDSFIGDRPSSLDQDYSETLDNSFIGNRPSNLNQEDDYNRTSLDDSFASDRPSNLDVDYNETLDDSFTSDRPSNLDVDYNETLDDSFTGDRSSNLETGSDEPIIISSSSDWDNATNPIATAAATELAPANSTVPIAPAVAMATNDQLVEPKLSFIKREGSNESIDNSFARERTRVDDDSFARGSLDNAYDEAEDSTADEDVSFRMSGPAGDYLDDDNNDDSFVGGEPSISYSEAGGAATSKKASSSFENPGRSGFYDASRAFDQEFDYGNADIRQSNRGDAIDLYSRESTDSAASLSASSYDNQQSFFVGSMGSEAEALSYLPMASSPAYSDVVMLGDEGEAGKSHESSSLDLQSLAVCTSSSEGSGGVFSPREEPPLLPVTIQATTTTSPGVSVVTKVSSTAAVLAVAPRSSFVNANESLAISPASVGQNNDSITQAFSFSRKSVSSETLSDLFMRDSNQGIPDAAVSSFMEDNSFRLSSPNAVMRASEQNNQESFVSESSFADDSFTGDDSFSSANFSEVAARHIERRSSEMSHDSKGKRDAQAGAPIVASSPANSQPLVSSPPGADTQAERQTDELLDFTGVYRDSVQSNENARVSLESRNTVIRLEDKIQDPSLRLTATPVSLVRARSDSIQRASERKVEDFFRRTYNFNKDDEDLNFADTQNRRTRARTTVDFNVHMEEDEEQQVYHEKPFMTDAARQRSKSTGAKKTINLRSMRAGSSAAFALTGSGAAGAGFAPKTRSRAVSRPSTRLQIKEDLLEVAPSERRSRLTFRSSEDSSSSIDTTEGNVLEKKMQELQSSRVRQNSAAANEMSSSRVIQRNFTISISSETRSSNSIRDDSPNMIPMPPHYMLSPKTESPIKMSGTSVFAISKGLGKSKMGGKDNSNANGNGNPSTPTLPGLSMAASSLTPSPFSASYAASSSSKMPQSQFAQSGGGMAPGFMWSTQEQLQHLESRSDESGGMSIKESIWHETRPTLSDQVATHFQRFSSSLRNTLQRTGVRFFGQQPPGGGDPNQTTSPQSVCSAPPKLSRKFDDKNFYVRFGRGGGVEDNDEVIAAKQALGRNRNPENVFKKRHARTMVTLLCALLGVALGIGLIHVESLSASFNLPRAQQLLQQQLQPVVGGLKIATATQWILLPGKLFLRLWNCATLPLLFCHILNGIADMAINQKADLVLSFRSLGYMLCVSLITTLEGVGMMAAIKNLGLFKASPGTSNTSTKASAAALRRTLGVVDRKNGTVALMCESGNTYLQSTNGGKTFQCSNDSIPLPVYEEVIKNGTKFDSPAIFVFNDVNDVLKGAGTDTQSPLRYYPQAQSLNNASKQLINSLVPVNVVDSLVSSTPMSTVAIALLLGLVCGKRAWERGIHAKNGDFADSRIELAGEHVADKPHYVLGVFVELQLALEWLVDMLETLAPIGVLSLLAGNIVLHRQELMTIIEPMMQLVLSVVAVCMVHVLLVVPLFMKLCFKVNVFTAWSAFLPAYLTCFCTGSVILSLPIVQQCYERGNVVTKSMAQVAMGMLSVLHRNAHALYYPVAILWLLQTSTPASDVELTTKMCMTIGFLTLASCFFALHPVASVVSGTHGGSNLLVIVTLWRALLTFSANPGATSTPPTFPLLVACDVLLARFIAMVNLHDSLVVTRMIAEHCDEVVVAGTATPPVNSVDFAPSPMYI